MRTRRRSFLESIVFAAIILVLIETFLEDFAVVSGWSWTARRVLVFTGFFFDFFFTVEFLSRLYGAVFSGSVRQYLGRGRGWIDFLASIPLLLLSSGPAVLSVITGGTVAFAVGGMFKVLNVIKIIRIARILRLLRVLKIFKQIKYTDSTMAQRHVAKITSMAISIFVFVLFFASIGSSFVGIKGVDDIAADRNMETAQSLSASVSSGSIKAGDTAFASSNANLLLVRLNGRTLYSRYDNAYYDANFGPSDYQYISVSGMQFYFDLRTVQRIHSRDNLIYFMIVIILTALLLFYYSPHFALTVTDPVQVMIKGMENEAYNYEVKILARYRDDDIYRLADTYNRKFLPLKDRNKQSSTAAPSVIQLDDVKDPLSGE